MPGAPVQTNFPTPEPAPPAGEEPENPEAEDEEDDGDWGISGFYQQQNTGTLSSTGTAEGNNTTTLGGAITYRRDATDDRLGIDAAVSYNQTTRNDLDGSQRQDSRLRAEATVGTNEAEMARARRLAQGGQ